jgi:cell division protease FtsH
MYSDLGPRTYGKNHEQVFLGRDISEEKDYSDTTASKIDEAVQKLVRDAEAEAKKIFNEHRQQVEKIVAALLDKETIEKEEFEALIESKT